MALRKLANTPPAVVGNRSVQIYRDAECEEYVCRLSIDGKELPECDYYTDDKDDARHTAWAIARHQSA